MPIVRTASGLVYYAHVPKCGGSSVENYLRERFGPLAFLDRHFLRLPPGQRWPATSPQHVDRAALDRLFPADFFAASFAVVRHPVARVVSAWHFQVGVEKTAAPALPFADWLHQQVALLEDNPFTADNHLRPQADFLPEGCAVFHLEHGLDAIIPWLDAVAGDTAGPRRIGHINRSDPAAKRGDPPTGADIALIERLYAGDFARFGYRPDAKAPLAPKPDPGADFLAQTAAARARARRFLPRTTARLKRRLRKWLE